PFALALASLSAPLGTALAQEPAKIADDLPKLANLLPAGYRSDATSIWAEAVQLENDMQLEQAALRYEKLTELQPEVSAGYWRAAGGHWRVADVALDAPRDERLARFEHARVLAAKGIQVDPQCAECRLWEFGSLGRISILRGVLWGARHGSEMAGLLEDGI